MALARIITRSHACSRELALDLLARGYTVEIVSPDAIPDNLADLELRVDNAGDQLVANVTAHDGNRSTSLEFLHHLKAPMGDFIRRVPDAEQEPSIAIPVESYAWPVALENGGDEAIPDVEGNLFEERAESQVPEAVGEQPVESMNASREEIAEPQGYEAENVSGGNFQASEEEEPVDSLSVTSAFTPHTVELVPELSPANEIPVYFEQEESSSVHPSDVEPLPHALRTFATKLRHRVPSWGWRVALTFTTVVVLALLLGFGLRHTGKAAAQSSSEAVAGKLAIAPNPATLPNARVPEKDQANSVVMTAAPDQEAAKDPGHVANRTIVAKAETRSAKILHPAQRRASRSHDGDVVARDTVVYLDDRYKPVPKTQSAKNAGRRHPTTRKRSGEVIAANKVTYLDKPAPKPAK
jgi:hypothetical protein